MKKIFALMTIAAITFSCGGDKNEDNPPTPNTDEVYLTLSGTDIVFDENGGEKHFTINCNSSWTITENASWLAPEKTNGNGDTQMKLTTIANDSHDDRNAVITIKAGTKTETFTVTQKQQNALIVTKDKFDILQSGGSFTIEVKSNINYTISVADNCKSWITEKPQTRALSSKSYTFEVSENPNTTNREGNITIKGENGTSETVTVYQTQKNELILTQSGYTIPAKGEIITVELKTNVAYEVVIPTAAQSWIKQLASERDDRLIFDIAPNSVVDERNAEITIKDKNSELSQTLKIKQILGQIILEKDEYEVPAKGETITASLTTDIDFEVIIPSGVQSWINKVETRSLESHFFNLVIAPNSGADTRTADIKVKDRNSDLFQLLKIRQDANKITARQDYFEITAAGGSINIQLIANVDYAIQMPDVDWLTASTSDPNNHIYHYSISKNISTAERITKIIYINESLNIKEEIKILQAGSEQAFIHVEKAGTLYSLLQTAGLTNSTNLKITGVLNDVDFAVFHSMSNLIALDLSEIVITTLPNQAFSSLSTLQSIILPNTLIEIGDRTFYNCSSLKEIVIGFNVSVIGTAAFYQCYSLKSVEIPASVEEIKPDAFARCLYLENVTFESNSQLKIIRGGCVPRVDHDGDGAFLSCSSLISIEIPASVEIIETGAFKNCINLTSLTFENNSQLKTIDGDYSYNFQLFNNGAFAGCKKLTNVELPMNLRTIGIAAFSDCSSLSSIKIPASVETIKSSAFKNCTSLTSVTFGNNSHLKTINGGIPILNKNIGAFTNCTSLTNIEIPASVETIGQTVFQGCTALTSVTFEASSQLKTIGGGYSSFCDYGAFSGCSKLINIEIPAKVEIIEAAVFRNCTSLTSVTFGAGSQLKTIGGGYYSYVNYYGAFSGCSKLINIEIPAKVEIIEATAFRDCTSLTTVTFGKDSQLKTIAGGYNQSGSTFYYYGAFYNCSSLFLFDASECTLIKVIGAGAFGVANTNITSLRAFYIGTPTPPTFEQYAFANGTPSDSVLKVPDSSVEAYKNSNWGNRFSNISGLNE